VDAELVHGPAPRCGGAGDPGVLEGTGRATLRSTSRWCGSGGRGRPQAAQVGESGKRSREAAHRSLGF